MHSVYFKKISFLVYNCITSIIIQIQLLFDVVSLELGYFHPLTVYVFVGSVYYDNRAVQDLNLFSGSSVYGSLPA